MKILVTGAAGFIGHSVCRRLLERGDSVVGVDSLSAYYDVGLKEARLAMLAKAPGFRFEQFDLADEVPLMALCKGERPERVVHLAAQPGVRYSIDHPHTYGQSNLVAFLNVLEACRQHAVGHLVFASSSSVYGDNAKVPYSESDNVDHPVSLYAATKKANELMAHSYAHLYGLPCTGLRFFTVYGPWGRPDMAYFSFTRAIFEGKPIRLFNGGDMYRDFTYIDDIVEGVVRTLDQPAAADPQWNGEAPNPATSRSPYRIYNIGNNRPEKLLDFVATLERCIGRKAIVELAPMQPGDVYQTYADTTALHEAVGFKPDTPLEEGLRRFVEWYRGYYGENPGSVL